MLLHSAAPPQRLPLLFLPLPPSMHFVQHRPSKPWSCSGQTSGRHTTFLQRTESALLFMGTPPVSPPAQERSSGAVTSSVQQRGQHVPCSSGAEILKGGLHSMAAQVTFSQRLGAAAGLAGARTRRPNAT